MKYVVSGVNVFYENQFLNADILVSDGIVAEVSTNLSHVGCDNVFSFNKCFVFPGLIDVHVHLREPGFIYKETIYSGTRAAARGGFTNVFAMPNLSPVPDCEKNLVPILKRIKETAAVNVRQYGAVTVGEKGEKLADIKALSKYTKIFSDDGKGIQNEEIMHAAMCQIKGVGGILAAHCEDNSLLGGSNIHDGAYAKEHGIKGISSESEWRQIERDLRLAKETGVKYHVCHISTKESVALIRDAKKNGVDVTCETAPHYLVLDDSCLQDDGRFKMNPPLRSPEDRKALIEGIFDGTIDCIATDHAPHSHEEKSKGLFGSNMGIVGLETSFPVMYTHFVKTGMLTLEKLIALMCLNPAKRFEVNTGIKIGQKADFTVFDLESQYTVNTDEFLSLGRSTPFEGMKVYGRCMMTVCDGKIVWREDNV